MDVTEEGKRGSDGGTPVASSREIWDRHASWWAQTFSEGADIEYSEEVIPLVCDVLGHCSSLLDIGCGEGQIARAITRVNPHARVIGIDPSGAQLARATKLAKPAISYVQGAGESLPFADGSFEAVICCLSIEHCEDVDRVLAEVARVLAREGTFLLLINHPMYQGPGSGLIDDQILGERYWRVGPYLREGVAEEQVDVGVTLPFAHRPLSRYLNPLAEVDLFLTRMYEPPPLAAFLEDSVDVLLESAIPRLLGMQFEHRPRSRIRADHTGRARKRGHQL